MIARGAGRLGAAAAIRTKIFLEVLFMRSFRVFAAFAAGLSCSALAHAQLDWPEFMHTLKSGASKSPVAATVLADAVVEAPLTDVPEAQARWSGRWTGWACTSRACDTRLVVEKVSATGATIVYAFASADIAPYAARASAQFVGEELHAVLPACSKLKYRMRPSGKAIEFHCQKGSQWVAGVLSREP